MIDELFSVKIGVVNLVVSQFPYKMNMKYKFIVVDKLLIML